MTAQLAPFASVDEEAQPQRGARLRGGVERPTSQWTASDWLYVSVRRVAVFLEESLSRGLPWAVFEPNTRVWWERHWRNLTSSLHDLLRSAASAANVLRDACLFNDRAEAMSQDDVDQGGLHMPVGVASSKPAEIVVICIQQLLRHHGTRRQPGRR